MDNFDISAIRDAFSRLVMIKLDAKIMGMSPVRIFTAAGEMSCLYAHGVERCGKPLLLREYAGNFEQIIKPGGMAVEVGQMVAILEVQSNTFWRGIVAAEHTSEANLKTGEFISNGPCYKLPVDIDPAEVAAWEFAILNDFSSRYPYQDWCREKGLTKRADELWDDIMRHEEEQRRRSQAGQVDCAEMSMLSLPANPDAVPVSMRDRR